MENTEPNIVLIMDDQHRYDWIGCAGAGWVSTPNIDDLAGRGIRFENCVTNSAICAPARIALASGLRPFRVGAFGNDAILPMSCPTYYQRLRDAGYHVGCVGKLDLAKSSHYNGRHGNRPLTFSWGFTHPYECEGKIHAGRWPDPQGPYGEYLRGRGLYERFHEDYRKRHDAGWILDYTDSVLPEDAFQDVFIGREAVNWIEKASTEYPFHLFVSFAGPHNPYDPPAEFARRYRDRAMPDPIQCDDADKPRYLSDRKITGDLDVIAATRRQYAAAIEVIDTEIGRIVRALENKGVLEDTVLIFTSDHGEMIGDFGCYTKGLPYEGAVRVPLVAAGPGIERDVESSALVELIDVNATICDLAGLGPQSNIDARSFSRALRQPSADHRDECYCEVREFRLLRTREHKLVENVNDITELYELGPDPEEKNNIASQSPRLVRELRNRMIALKNNSRF